MLAFESAAPVYARRALFLLSTALGAIVSAAPAVADLAPNEVLIVPKPDPSATSYNVSGINYDGSVIFGTGIYTSSANRPFVWEGGATSTDLGAFISPVDGQPYAFNGFGAVGSNAVSDDGTVLVGTSSSSLTPGRAWIWREGVGYQDLGLPPGGSGSISAFAVSRDGTTVVGLASGSPSGGYRWRQGTGFEFLGAPVVAGQTYSGVSALGTNGDGSVIVGFASRTAPTSLSVPFIWREDTGFEIINTGFGSGAGQARAVSADGTIVGGRALPNAANERIFRRDGAGNILLIDPMAGDGWTEFRGMSADGSKIVGISGNDTPANGRQAILWTTTDGTRTLNAIVAAANLPNAGLDLRLATAISGDGSTIIGSGRNSSGADLPFALRLVTISHVPTQSQSLTQLVLPDAILQNITTTSYDTGVAGRLNGAEVFGARFDEMTSGPAVQQGFLDAEAAIRSAAGLRRVTIEAPLLTRSETQTIDVTDPVETQIVETLPDQINTYTTPGPATVATGDLGICTSPGDETTPPSGCSLPGTPVEIGADEINDNTHTASFERITRVLTTTTDERLVQDWSVAGTLGTQIGTVHAIAGVAAFDTAERFTRRLLAARFAPPPRIAAPRVAGDVWPKASGPSPYVAIFEGYGFQSERDADPANGVQDIRLDGEGFTAALANDVAPSVTLGLAGELSNRDAAIRDPQAPESLDMQSVQGGAFAVLRHGRFSAAASVGGGRSAIDTRIAESGGQTASYDATFWSAALELAADIPVTKRIVLTPLAGAQWSRAKLDGFTESGASPSLLVANGTTLEARRAWLGLRAAGTFETDQGTLIAPNAYVRYVRQDGDFEGRADVAFAAAPATTLLALGPRVAQDVVEAGAAIDVVSTDDTTISIGYDGGFANGYGRHEVKASLTMRF